MNASAQKIVQTLQSHNFEAYFAGGYVRDMVMGKKLDEINDIDIATNAKPEEIENIFPKTFPLGKNFGVIVVRENKINFEVATFRSDSGTSDGRRPDSIKYSDMKNDALRRDFTINGMFYDPISEKIIDLVNGKLDISRGILRFIGDAETRIREDFLRILRAVRFKNRFDLTYEKNTKKQLQLHASSVFMVSSERIMQELNKIIVHHSRSRALQDMFSLTLLQHIIPEISEMKSTFQPKDHHSEGDVFSHTLTVLQNIPEGENIELYWALFFHDIGKPFTKKFDGKRWRYPNHENVGAEKTKDILEKLKFPRKQITKICWLVKHEQIFDSFFKMKLSTRLHYYDHLYFQDLLKLHKYDLLGSIPTGEKNIISKKERLTMIYQIEENFQFALQNKMLPSHNDEFFTGKEIMEILDLKPGKKIGEILHQLREMQMEGELGDKEEARRFLKSYCLLLCK